MVCEISLICSSFRRAAPESIASAAIENPSTRLVAALATSSAAAEFISTMSLPGPGSLRRIESAMAAFSSLPPPCMSLSYPLFRPKSSGEIIKSSTLPSL